MLFVIPIFTELDKILEKRVFYAIITEGFFY
jgi:hypothetical protein